MYIDLAGEWEVWLEELNPEQEVRGEREPEREPDGQVSLPGILQSQGFGNPISRNTPWVSGLHDPFILRERHGIDGHFQQKKVTETKNFSCGLS